MAAGGYQVRSVFALLRHLLRAGAEGCTPPGLLLKGLRAAPGAAFSLFSLQYLERNRRNIFRLNIFFTSEDV